VINVLLLMVFESLIVQPDYALPVPVTQNTESKSISPLLQLDMSHQKYRGADKSLARPTSRCILFDGENISFDASPVIYIYIYKALLFLQL
jgi:hypothetical protein